MLGVTRRTVPHPDRRRRHRRDRAAAVPNATSPQTTKTSLTCSKRVGRTSPRVGCTTSATSGSAHAISDTAVGCTRPPTQISAGSPRTGIETCARTRSAEMSGVRFGCSAVTLGDDGRRTVRSSRQRTADRTRYRRSRARRSRRPRPNARSTKAAFPPVSLPSPATASWPCGCLWAPRHRSLATSSSPRPSRSSRPQCGSSSATARSTCPAEWPISSPSSRPTGSKTSPSSR